MFDLGSEVREYSSEEYIADFGRYWGHATPGFAKLERQQHFIEPGNDSWEAFYADDWDRAVELAEADFKEIRQAALEAGFPIRRARIVGQPVSDYLRWELMVLRVRARAGEDIRIVSADSVARYETHGELPELTVVGHQAAYRVIYNDDGLMTGAVGTHSSTVCAALYSEIASLCDRGTPLLESSYA